MQQPGQHAVYLMRDDDRVREVDLLAEATGGRVGLPGVLGDLNRKAIHGPIPGRAATWGFALDLRDSSTLRWWPQGVTTSADGSPDETYGGRRVVVTSSYSKNVRGINKGARLTVFDVTDPAKVRYRHVLLVEAVVRDGTVTLQPIRIHAGGIVWHGGYVHVAGTARGLFTFALDDILRLPRETSEDAVGLLPDGRYAGYGHRYVLPVRFKYVARTDEGFQRIRYSFLSLDRSGDQHQLVAGEYGRRGQTTRLIRYDMDPATGLVDTDPEGASRPRTIELDGIEQMQGAASVRGRLYVTQSKGRVRRGNLWVGAPGALVRHKAALPQGPEDLCYWPSTDQLWSVSEHPMLRFVFTMDRSHFD